MPAPAGVLKTVSPNPVLDGSFMFGTNDQNLSNEQIVLGPLAAEAVAGTVLGKVTATGIYVPLNPAASDGSQTFAGLLFGARPASASNQKATAVVRRQGVNARLLTYVNAVSAPQKAAIEAAMAAAGIIPRY